MPPFEAVLRAVLDAIVVEGARVADEIREANPACVRLLETSVGVPLDVLPHETFKRRAARAAAVVRTGEATPYANVILRCGVPFR